MISCPGRRRTRRSRPLTASDRAVSWCSVFVRATRRRSESMAPGAELAGRRSCGTCPAEPHHRRGERILACPSPSFCGSPRDGGRTDLSRRLRTTAAGFGAAPGESVGFQHRDRLVVSASPLRTSLLPSRSRCWLLGNNIRPRTNGCHRASPLRSSRRRRHSMAREVCFPKLQGPQAGTTLPMLWRPPREIGTT